MVEKKFGEDKIKEIRETLDRQLASGKTQYQCIYSQRIYNGYQIVRTYVYTYIYMLQLNTLVISTGLDFKFQLPFSGCRELSEDNGGVLCLLIRLISNLFHICTHTYTIMHIYSYTYVCSKTKEIIIKRPGCSPEQTSTSCYC